MAVRELRLFEDPDLQKVSRPVTEVNDHIRGLLDDLAETLKALNNCRALAANQVGIMRRLAVIDTGSEILKLINPVIVEQIGTQETEEDCVCFKDIAGIMLRPRRIVLEALDENGQKVILAAEGEEASMYCHVIDHLDGKILVKEVTRFSNGPLEGE
jgi:peptide deformylase